MNDYKTKRKQAKLRTIRKNYVDYVVQDCPIAGKRVIRHFINEEKKIYDRNRK